MAVFALFFAVFAFYRGENIEMYESSQRALNQNFGAINTLLLLASSWFVVLGMKLGRTGKARAAANLLTLAALCGIGFGISKIFEYSEKVHDGITLTTNEFFMFYYVLTGIHMMHVTIGLGILSFMILQLRRSNEQPNMMMLESGATFWHMVDLLWIVLFPLLYLMR